MAEEPWEECLDLDEFPVDISSLRPCKRQNTAAAASSSLPSLQRCTSLSQNPQTLPSQNTPLHQPQPPPSRIIPGPAGTLQGAMLRLRNNNSNNHNPNEELIPTQEYLRRAVEDAVEDDDDFTRDPWLSAVQFIRLQGLTDGDGAIGIPLSKIKIKSNFDKVSQVVAIVKCCTLNGLGDMMVTLKDPTATIDATIHRRVLADREFSKGISIGAVMIVQKVAVFSPSRSARYLNITHSNVVKVIPKDTSPLTVTQNISAPVVKHTALSSEHNENSSNAQKPFSLKRGRTEGIMSCLRQNATRGIASAQQIEIEEATRQSCDNDGNNKSQNSIEIEEATRQSCDNDGNNENQNSIAGKVLVMAEQDVVNGSNETINVTDNNNSNEVVPCEQLNSSTQARNGTTMEDAQYGRVAGGSVNVLDDQESGNVSGNKYRQPPQWTDEQLDELFAFD